MSSSDPLCDRALTAWLHSLADAAPRNKSIVREAFEAGWIMRGKSSGKSNEVWIDEAPRCMPAALRDSPPFTPHEVETAVNALDDLFDKGPEPAEAL